METKYTLNLTHTHTHLFTLFSFQEMLRFPKLHTKLMEIVSDLLMERLSPTSDYVASLIAIECAYINTNHPDFPGPAATLAELQKQATPPRSSRRQQVKHEKAVLLFSLTNEPFQVPNGISSSDHRSSPPKSDTFINYFFGGPNSSQPGLATSGHLSLEPHYPVSQPSFSSPS